MTLFALYTLRLADTTYKKGAIGIRAQYCYPFLQIKPSRQKTRAFVDVSVFLFAPELPHPLSIHRVQYQHDAFLFTSRDEVSEENFKCYRTKSSIVFYCL